MIKNIMKRQVFFFIKLSFRMLFFVLFLRKRLLHFPCILCYLFMYENIQTNIKGKTLRNSHSQMFFKIAVLKNLAVLSRKHLSWSLFLINFYLKKRLQHRCFHVNIAKYLISYFSEFYLMIEFLGRLVVQI